MKKPSKFIALCLAFIMSCNFMAADVWAAAPTATYDEAVYINLDYYGQISNCSVVKGVSLNGNTTFKDYGNYEEVNNMSGYEKPVMMDGGLLWEVPKGTDLLYYEVKLKDRNVELPWTFDIGYKLNGKPAFADQLAGAKGLVEITIHVIPNPHAQAYYLNNMLLQVAMPVNMEHTLSIEAPGSQLQSVGTYKMVLFMALPGQEDTYTVRIGSDSFETMGITMTMLPGTSSQLQVIKDLRETRETYSAAYESLYKSYNDLLNVVLSMDNGLSQMKSGVENLDQSVSTGDLGKIVEQLNKLSGNLRTLSKNIKDMVSYTDRAGKTISKLSALAEENNTLLSKISKDLDKYKFSVEALKSTINDFQQLINNTQSYEAEREALSQELYDDLSNIKTDFKNLESDTSNVAESVQAMQVYLAQLNDYLDTVQNVHLNAEDYYLDSDQVPAEMADSINSVIDSIIAQVNTGLDQSNGTLNEAIVQIKSFNILLIQFLENIVKPLVDMQSLLQHSSELITTVQQLIVLLDGDSTRSGLLDNLDEGLNITSTMLNETEDLCDTVINSISLVKTGISQIQKMNTILIKEGKNVAKALRLCSSSLENISEICGNLADLTDSLADQVNKGAQAGQSAHQIMQGLAEVLDKSIKGLAVTNSLKDSGNIMHDTLDNQIDKLDANSNILSLDPDAKLISFTSSKNNTPESIQVILRTQEISLMKNAPGQWDAEAKKADRGFFGRIIDIFIKIGKALASIFE